MSQQNPTILERIDMCERATEQLWKLFEVNFGEVKKTLAAFTETMAAIMVATGVDFEPKVMVELKKIRTARLESENTRNKAVIDQLLDNKVIEAAAAIGPDSIVTGRYLDKASGEVVEPGYQQLEAKNFTEDAQKALQGQTVGFAFGIPGSNTNFEVTGVYQYVKAAVKAEAAVTVELKEPEAAPAEPVAADPAPATTEPEVTAQADLT